MVVHNRNAAVRGRLARAVPFRDPASGALVRQTLGEALGLSPTDNAVCRIREARSGRELAVASREVWVGGLELELEPYDARVFLRTDS